jgi:hypothetical protein
MAQDEQKASKLQKELEAVQRRTGKVDFIIRRMLNG